MRMLNPLIPKRSHWSRSLDLIDTLEDFESSINWLFQLAVERTHPSFTVNDAQNHYLVKLDMPGVKPEDIKIEFKNNKLMISGERYTNEAKGSSTTKSF